MEKQFHFLFQASMLENFSVSFSSSYKEFGVRTLLKLYMAHLEGFSPSFSGFLNMLAQKYVYNFLDIFTYIKIFIFCKHKCSLFHRNIKNSHCLKYVVQYWINHCTILGFKAKETEIKSVKGMRNSIKRCTQVISFFMRLV